jgi:uncharacterized damage-inducible protein DinB
VSSRIKIEPESWLEKEFVFYYPVGALPAILERLRGTPNRLEWTVSRFPHEILKERIGEEWSIQEHVGHLYDLEELHEGRLDDFDAGLDTLRAADMTNEKTYKADHNKGSLSDLLAKFRETRMRFVARFEELTAEEAARSAIHPRLKKPMRVIDLAHFTAEHDDHHLANITYLARTLLDERR